MIRLVFPGMLGLALALCAGPWAATGPAVAQTRSPAPQLAPDQPPQFRAVDAERVAAAMQVDLLAGVLAAEIAQSGDPFAPDPGPGAAPDEGWNEIVDRLASAARIRAGLREGIGSGVAELGSPVERAAVAEALAFWESELGRRIMLLEIGAREAMSAPGIEAQARDAFATAAARNHPRVDQVRALIEAADLVEPAVAASLNIAVATLRGAYAAAGADAADPSIIEDAWLQEPEIRADQTGWIEALVFMASAPLSDAEMVQLIRAAGQPGQRRLSTMLNEAAVATFTDVAEDLGHAAAMRRMGERL